MVLHLPGSTSIMTLITLSKESISLFSFSPVRWLAQNTVESQGGWRGCLLMQCVSVIDTSVSASNSPKTAHNSLSSFLFLDYL